MLARLEEIAGLERAEIDHRGELLRLRVAETAVEEARGVLAELGYDVGEVGTVPADARWYGSATVRELSREEARIITGRVVPGFASAHRLSTDETERLRAVVAEALYAYFHAHMLGAGAPAGALRAECVEQVATAATAVIGAERARDLASRLAADLARSSDGAASS